VGAREAKARKLEHTQSFRRNKFIYDENALVKMSKLFINELTAWDKNFINNTLEHSPEPVPLASTFTSTSIGSMTQEAGSACVPSHP